ncbi:chemotaxis response regulator protein-glutamate methylesterase [Tepidamorphus sp. 3E244]|uniref:protein-glutamate methylesterase/protein-glutamine glutaminase n=1 Tax=Tepidamorphus sp. 3E244 TaxID=3385498 RepID=UPI0038FD0F37
MTLTATRPTSPPASAANAIRVCVVDDAVVVRGMVTRWVNEEDGIELVGSYRNGQVAVEKAPQDKPHVIVLDIEMPEMDGLTALPLLLKACPGVKIVMASTLTRRNAEISLKALSLGAADYVPKPETNSGVSTSSDFRRELIEKIRALGAAAAGRPQARVPFSTPPSAKPGAAAARPATAAPSPGLAPAGGAGEPIKHRSFSRIRPTALVIGSSTGGPPALAKLLGTLSSDIWKRMPVLITQHMPATFTAILAEHLTRAARIPAAEAENGEPIVPGRIYVAPGGKHMIVAGTRAAPKIRLTDDAPVHFCKPAVDPLFQSAATVWNSAVLGVVLTGMGCDGANGSVSIADAGGTILAQDKESSVVWGMPGAVAQSGASAALMTVEEIGRKINSLAMGALA